MSCGIVKVSMDVLMGVRNLLYSFQDVLEVDEEMDILMCCGRYQWVCMIKATCSPSSCQFYAVEKLLCSKIN